MRPGPLLRAMRPYQWSKNLFVLAALVFAAGARRENGGALAREHWLASLCAFAAFCLASSAVYLANDVLDVEKDRAHPEKRRRPIAAGELSVNAALAAALVCFAGALALGFALGGGPRAAAILAGYGALNLAYSWRL